MHITKQLDAEMTLHESKTGQKCWAIYLGRQEMERLLDWGKESLGFEDKALEGRNRPQYNGALVYLVNDDTHMNVG